MVMKCSSQEKSKTPLLTKLIVAWMLTAIGLMALAGTVAVDLVFGLGHSMSENLLAVAVVLAICVAGIVWNGRRHD